MPIASLRFIEVENFKCYRGPARVDLKPLTVVIGANNSGKSTIVQALLLLKQTLAGPQTNTPLALEGMVNALNLRELTWGWPPQGARVPGPRFKIGWHCQAIDWAQMARRPSGPFNWQEAPTIPIDATLDLRFAEEQGETVLESATADFATPGLVPPPQTTFRRKAPGSYTFELEGQISDAHKVTLLHFFPFAIVGSRPLDPDEIRDRGNFGLDERFEWARSLLHAFSYLGSSRLGPSTLYRPVSSPPEEIGAAGEYAAPLLRARRSELVHYPLPPRAGDLPALPITVAARPLGEAVTEVLNSLGAPAVRVEDIQNVGFRLFFGQASAEHAGRGFNSLLPTIVFGLIADPLQFSQELAEGAPLAEYLKRCGQTRLCALEEPEAHLHPKLQSRLAEWIVALASAGRQWIIETHSDHFVRRLRRLAAQAGAGSALETWLLENVNIVEVEQAAGGESKLTQSGLTSGGGIKEHWPADFMDEAGDEESAIYYAKLEKAGPTGAEATRVELVEGAEPEPEEAP